MKNLDTKALLVMFLCLLSGKAMAYDAKVNDIYYNFSGTEATVTYLEKNSNQEAYVGNVVIPAQVTYDGQTYDVTSIGWWAFANCQKMTSVTIPNSVTSIASSAFVWCKGLTSINIPSSVETIGSYAFSKCGGLTDITIPEGVKSIDRWAFYECDALTSVSLPASIGSIGEHAFHGCENLNKVEYKSIESLCSIKFNWLSNPLYYAHHLYIAGSEVSDLVIPSGIKAIGDYAFQGANKLKTITIGNDVEEIGAWAFSGCTGLTTNTCVIPDNVKKINDCAFYNTNFRFVTIGSGIESFGLKIFDFDNEDLEDPVGKPSIAYWLYDTNLHEELPAGYETLDIDANYVLNDSCAKYMKSGLRNITVCPAISNIFEVNGIKYVSDDNTICHVIGGMPVEGSEDVTIPASLTYGGNTMSVANIMPYAFYGCTQMETLEINCTDSIGQNAFQNCTSLRDITINSDLKFIGDNAFNGCKKVTNLMTKALTPPVCEKASAISAFRTTCKVVLYESAKSAYKKATGWKDFTAVCATNIDNIIDVDDWKLVYNEKKDTCFVLGNNTEDADIVIPATVSYEGNTMAVTKVLPFAFFNSEFVKTVVMDDIEVINANAFYGCANILSITLGEQLTDIEETAFKNCKKVIRITSKNATAPVCGKNAINDINKDKCKVLIPADAAEAYKADNTWTAFKALCPVDIDNIFVADSIAYVINEEKDAYTVVGSMHYGVTVELTIPETMTDEATGIELPVKNIMPYAFLANTEIETLDIKSAGVISNNAFQGCNSLQILTLGEAIDSLGNEAFLSCTKVDSIACMSLVPPTCGKDALKDVKKKTCRLSIPFGTLEVYKVAEPWNEFFDNEKMIERPDDSNNSKETTSIEELMANENGRQAEVFDLNGRRLAQPRRGINIIRLSNGTIRKVLIQ